MMAANRKSASRQRQLRRELLSLYTQRQVPIGTARLVAIHGSALDAVSNCLAQVPYLPLHGVQAVQAEIRRAKADFAAADEKRQVRGLTASAAQVGWPAHRSLARVRRWMRLQTLEAAHEFLNQLDVLAERIGQAPASSSSADQVRH